ncbi:MAG: ferritin family protein [Desulfobacteraceae bacterium]|nr:MAG: ferritin family protein [Desulfobacteraceae bacterium]
MFTLGEIIDLAIQIEKNGENTYRKAQNEVPSSELASMLEGLADDEAEHEKWFAKLREDMDVEIEDPKLEEMGKSILRSVLGDQAFSMSDADFSRIDSIRTLLELSFEFEKDTIIFYEILKEFIEDRKVLTGIDKIIEEENRHVKHLEEIIEKGEI